MSCGFVEFVVFANHPCVASILEWFSLSLEGGISDSFRVLFMKAFIFVGSSICIFGIGSVIALPITCLLHILRYLASSLWLCIFKRPLCVGQEKLYGCMHPF